MGLNPVAVTWTSNFVPVWSKEFLDIQATIECRFTLKWVCDMTYSYTEQVLNFLLFDKHEYTHGIFWSIILVSIFMLWAYVTFSLFLKIWLTESDNSFSEELLSYWLLTLCHNIFPVKISSLHWNFAVCTCKEKLWQKVADEYQMS